MSLAVVVAVLGIPTVLCCAFVMQTGKGPRAGESAARPPPPAKLREGPADSLSTTWPRAQLQSDAAGMMTPRLVVHDADGLVLELQGTVAPGAQDETINIALEASHAAGGMPAAATAEDVLFMRAFVSEGREEDPGILLETPERVAIAFLDTALAVVREGSGSMPMAQRSIAIWRAMDGIWDMDNDAFAIVQVDSQSNYGRRFIARRGGARMDDRDATLLAVNVEPGRKGAAVVDAEGRIVATSKGRRLRIVSGADAGMVICCYLAALKLSPATDD